MFLWVFSAEDPGEREKSNGEQRDPEREAKGRLLGHRSSWRGQGMSEQGNCPLLSVSTAAQAAGLGGRSLYRHRIAPKNRPDSWLRFLLLLETPCKAQVSATPPGPEGQQQLSERQPVWLWGPAKIQHLPWERVPAANHLPG